MLTHQEISHILQGYAICHLIIWAGLKLVKLIGFTLYKLLVTNHFLQVAFDHGYLARRKHPNHDAEVFVCRDGKCQVIAREY